MIELFQEMKSLNIFEKYKTNVLKLSPEFIYDRAAMFASLHYDRYVCVNIDHLEFFVYTDNMWKNDHGHRHLIADLVRLFPQTGNNHTLRQQMIKDIAQHMYLEDFGERLGRYKALNFCGGVSFDVTSGVLRPGYPTDYTSMSTPCIPDVGYRDDVLSMLSDILPNTEIRAYFMRFMGSLLIPGNHDKIFMVWSGTGDNGKSVLARLVEMTLGEYSVRLPTSLLTGKRASSGSATPETVLLDKRLVAFLQEPGDNEKLNIGIVKELTGNDTLYVRGLYREGRNISVLAKIIYIVNSTDNMAKVEKATWNRIVVIPFSTHFTDHPKSAYERKKDIHLMSKLRKYAPAFLSLLVYEAKEYIKHGLIDSKAVVENTKSVMKENDHIHTFLANNEMEHTYQSFVNYMKSFNPTETIPSQKEYTQYSPIR
jgi:phage/plasmid-associated DNA primase